MLPAAMRHCMPCLRLPCPPATCPGPGLAAVAACLPGPPRLDKLPWAWETAQSHTHAQFSVELPSFSGFACRRRRRLSVQDSLDYHGHAHVFSRLQVEDIFFHQRGFWVKCLLHFTSRIGKPDRVGFHLPAACRHTTRIAEGMPPAGDILRVPGCNASSACRRLPFSSGGKSHHWLLPNAARLGW